MNTIQKQETSCEWKSYGSPRPVKTRKSKSKVKVMLIVFFHIQGIVYFEFLPQSQTVNPTVYKEILRRLVRSVREKRRSLREAHARALHRDNAPAHKALSICLFLAERNIATVEQPHIANLVPCDFFLFLKIKSFLKGTHFSDIFFFFFFRLLPTRGRHSATVVSISLDLLRLLP